MRASTEQERTALKSAVRLALKLAGGPERFSHVTAVKCPELSKYASASEDRQARIDVALELDREAGAPVVLGEMARLLGYGLSQGDRRDTTAATLADASRVARECLDVFNVVIEALADGRIDPAEGRVCRQQIAVAIGDPPWRFESWSHRGEDRSAVQHYDCMDLDAIAALPVSDIAARDAALFMWVIQPMLPEALKLIDAWGFTFKTVAFAWFKIKGDPEQRFLFADSGSVRKGMGYHTRSGMEQCWLATRGHGYERLTKGEAQAHLEGIREHSRKPEHFAHAIERLTGDVPKLEMFARTERPGWTAWGNQVGKFREQVA